MKRVIEVSAKTVETAIADGLKQLDVSMDEAEIRVINAGGLFKKAKVEISVGEDEPNVEKTAVKEKDVKPIEKKPAEKKSFERKQTDSKESSKSSKSNESAKAENTKAESVKSESVKSENVKEAAKQSQPKNNKPPFEKKDTKKSEKRSEKVFEERNVVSATVTEEHKKTAEAFLSEVLKQMKIDGKVVLNEDNGLRITIDTLDSAVIGYRGEVLDALQYLTSLIINEKGGKHVLLSVDALGYREKRAETLKRLANKTAERCLKINKRVSLEPMNSADRRIIHAELSLNDKVITRSEGHEPVRRVVVLPKR